MSRQREINCNNMVVLPMLSALTAVVLAEQLITHARKEETLPPFIERMLLRLEAAVAGLKVQIQPRAEEDTEEKRRADRALDNAWRALNQWLGALVLMPSDSLPHWEKLQMLYNLLFSDGMTFINISYREQWAESDTRLSAVAEGAYDTAIAESGGAPLFDHLKAAHETYGNVLGISAAKASKASPAIRETYLVLLDTVRAFIVKAVAWADPEEPGSEALSDRLIAPLVNWQDPRARHTDDTAEENAEAAIG